MFTQIIAPDPDISCRPGWCLEYVRRTFRLAVVHPTATAAWMASNTKHRDRNFPAGVWLPVWYALANEPAGHVVLRAPDGSVYSTSTLSNTPYHHPDLAHLEGFYARYGMPLTYRGWTEDVQGTPVIAPNNIVLHSTPKDDTVTKEQAAEIIRQNATLIEQNAMQIDMLTNIGNALNESRDNVRKLVTHAGAEKVVVK